MNAELCKQVLAKVGNPNVLVNIISRRVRQLNAGGGAGSRPLVIEIAGMGAADIAMTELIEEKMAWELFDEPAAAEPGTKKRKKA